MKLKMKPKWIFPLFIASLLCLAGCSPKKEEASSNDPQTAEQENNQTDSSQEIPASAKLALTVVMDGAEYSSINKQAAKLAIQAFDHLKSDDIPALPEGYELDNINDYWLNFTSDSLTFSIGWQHLENSPYKGMDLDPSLDIAGPVVYVEVHSLSQAVDQDSVQKYTIISAESPIFQELSSIAEINTAETPTESFQDESASDSPSGNDNDIDGIPDDALEEIPEEALKGITD